LESGLSAFVEGVLQVGDHTSFLLIDFGLNDGDGLQLSVEEDCHGVQDVFDNEGRVTIGLQFYDILGLQIVHGALGGIQSRQSLLEILVGIFLITGDLGGLGQAIRGGFLDLVVFDLGFLGFLVNVGDQEVSLVTSLFELGLLVLQ
jgi:hypothetical protein